MTKKRNHTWILIVLGIESACFVYGYYWGSRGLSLYYIQQEKNRALESHITTEQAKLKKLKEEFVNWGKNPLYKERIARTTLKMAHAHETIYMIE